MINEKQHASIKDIIRKKLHACSNNQFLDGFLESPNSLKEIFKLSRILFKEMQHLVLVGHSGGGKLEFLQLTAILNSALLLELQIPRLGETFKFITSFKKAVLAAIGVDKPTFIVIGDNSLRDPLYVDYLHNFMLNMCNKYEKTVLWSD